MIIEAMTKFWSRFQIQIFLRFHWRAEKMIKIKLVMAMVKMIFSPFTFSVTILFNHD